MESYYLEWLELTLRWGHAVVGIAWIGSSFYFMWLDANLNIPPRDPENSNVAGDLWALHGGGFYHAQKYATPPGELPEPLHWFKWEAYTTWLTGFALLTLIYWAEADLYLLDQTRGVLTSQSAAIGASAGLLIGGWLLYHGLCSWLTRELVFTIVGAAVVLFLVWLLTHLFSGRGAYLQIGAMLGTIMTANVWLVIIPAQKELVRAKRQSREPDSSLGTRAKRRSTHNNYLTLPVIIAMLSPHYPMTYGHTMNWLVLGALFLVGGLTRHYFNLRNQGRNGVGFLIAAIIVLSGPVLLTSNPTTTPPQAPVSFNEIETIIGARCRPCHSAMPTYQGTTIAAGGVNLDVPSDAVRWAYRIYDRVVVTETMPVNNATGMTAKERRKISAWFADTTQSNP